MSLGDRRYLSGHPEFPVQLSRVEKLHAAFFTESRICHLGRYSNVGNPGVPYGITGSTRWEGMAGVQKMRCVAGT
jgi:hypothetical protein